MADCIYESEHTACVHRVAEIESPKIQLEKADNLLQRIIHHMRKRLVLYLENVNGSDRRELTQQRLEHSLME